jgi:hypothetical protein
MGFDFSSLLNPQYDNEGNQRQNKLLDFGEILNGLSGGAAAGRQAQAQANQGQDQTRLGIQNQQQQAAAFNRQAPGLRATNAVRGDLLSGLQSVGSTGSGRDLHFTGGLSPALLSANTRQLGSDMTRQALLSQLGKSEGSRGPGQNDPYTFDPQFTQPTPLPHPSLLSKIGGVLGGGASILGSIFGL